MLIASYSLYFANVKWKTMLRRFDDDIENLFTEEKASIALLTKAVTPLQQVYNRHRR